MNTVDTIAEILKREGVEYLMGFPTTPLLESAALAGIRPIICRQEQVGQAVLLKFITSAETELSHRRAF